MGARAGGPPDRYAPFSGCRRNQEGGAMERPYRPVESFRVRRSCLAVPASSERFIEKAHGLPADEVFLDLEDAVAPAAKAQARGQRGRGGGR